MAQRRIGRYEILGEISAGGQATVYRGLTWHWDRLSRSTMPVRLQGNGKHAWFSGFRLAWRTGLLDQVPRAWSIVPTAVNEREAGEDLVHGVSVAHLLADRGFRSKRWRAVLAERGTTLLTTPDQQQRREWPPDLRRFMAAHRNRIESGISLGEHDDIVDTVVHSLTWARGRQPGRSAKPFFLPV